MISQLNLTQTFERAYNSPSSCVRCYYLIKYINKYCAGALTEIKIDFCHVTKLDHFEIALRRLFSNMRNLFFSIMMRSDKLYKSHFKRKSAFPCPELNPQLQSSEFPLVPDQVIVRAIREFEGLHYTIADWSNIPSQTCSWIRNCCFVPKEVAILIRWTGGAFSEALPQIWW